MQLLISEDGERATHRNGYRELRLEKRLGTMSLRIPKLRSGSYFPSFLEPRKTSEQALEAAGQEAYVKGISTRKIDDSARGAERFWAWPAENEALWSKFPRSLSKRGLSGVRLVSSDAHQG